MCSRTDGLEVLLLTDSKGLQDSSWVLLRLGEFMAPCHVCPVGLKPFVWPENCHLDDNGAVLCPAKALLQCLGLNLSQAIYCSL